jgi:hypothetical protein
LWKETPNPKSVPRLSFRAPGGREKSLSGSKGRTGRRAQ